MRTTLAAVNAQQRDKVGHTVVAIIPAWNEEATIAATVTSVHRQTVPVGRIVVVVNNTTDNTAIMAEQAGAEVIIMEDNRHKKAGALNYALELLADSFDDASMLLVMDADTTLEECFVETAAREMSCNSRVGGVSSVFVGRESDSLLGALQQMEYFRYKREIHRHGDRAFVLSGTASLVRWRAFRQIKAARIEGQLLPQGSSYYDTRSLTEDNELTFALLTLGWQCPAPGATSTTDVMENLRDLQQQRRRWYLGALGNLWHYGAKMPWYLRWIYWKQQAGLVAAILASSIVLLALGINLAYGNLTFSWFFTLLLALHLMERAATVWRMGARYRTIALSYVPELLYAITLLSIFAFAAVDHVRGRTGSWHKT